MLRGDWFLRRAIEGVSINLYVSPVGWLVVQLVGRLVGRYQRPPIWVFGGRDDHETI